MSKLLDNPAVGGPEDSPRFLNAAVEVQTTLKAPDLLNQLLEIEQAIGRRRHMKWEPRIIDLDLLLYGNR
jgi:2-amino-4-hydroxy-6-hydroxymethyldihydropteridine diphosphokinase